MTDSAKSALAKAEMTCPFCSLPPSRITAENRHAIWIYDGYPVSAGHSLIIPKRHIGSFFEASDDERQAMLLLLDQAKAAVQQAHQPDAFNIGINDGAAAGQTVPHLHLHLIPRYRGDVEDPRGGVRWVIPHKADYWTGR
ncbi:HIT family protein [Craterilacuibacter sp.]|uniref:HIT family protein n=1 Tax=Craterilacuibacter sp. TaxID=2870909 RepID=UPI003F3A69EF